MSKKGPVLVKWADSSYPSGKWQDRRAAKKHKPAICYSVGWVLSVTKKKLTIASDDGGHEVGFVTTIPASCVLKITPLRKAKK